MRRGGRAGARPSSSSCPVSGLRTHETPRAVVTPPWQAWQPMQGTISDSRPASDLPTKSGSAISARANATRSVAPSATAASADSIV